MLETVPGSFLAPDSSFVRSSVSQLVYPSPSRNQSVEDEKKFEGHSQLPCPFLYFCLLFIVTFPTRNLRRARVLSNK